ncbi:MAG: hopanoid-associated sugar epimerase [Nitrospirota bacterium]
MKAFVTGATGFIGYHIARLLQTKGVEVRALVREGSDASLLQELDVEVLRGDLRDEESVSRAMKTCKHVYHVAADYRLWVPDVKAMYDSNVQGTRNILQAAYENSVEKVVYTSTVGILTASRNGKISDETCLASQHEMVGHYKKSKFLAEQEVYSFLNKGVPIVIVNPSTPIGTFDRKPTPTGNIIVDFINGKIPAYLDTGLNFVDVEDVAAGHLLAAERGSIGERYILGNRNMSLKKFFELLAILTNRKPPRIRFPYIPVLVAAYVDEAWAHWATHKQPTIPLTGVKMAKKYMYFNSAKAVRELGMPQTPVEYALEKALYWFVENGYVQETASPSQKKIA